MAGNTTAKSKRRDWSTHVSWNGPNLCVSLLYAELPLWMTRIMRAVAETRGLSVKEYTARAVREYARDADMEDLYTYKEIVLPCDCWNVTQNSGLVSVAAAIWNSTFDVRWCVGPWESDGYPMALPEKENEFWRDVQAYLMRGDGAPLGKGDEGRVKECGALALSGEWKALGIAMRKVMRRWKSYQPDKN